MIEYLQPTFYLDCNHPALYEYAKANSNESASEKENAIQLYYAVRDGLWYDPYDVKLAPEEMKASAILERGRGHCGEKATVLAACLRAIGIPARLEFADVKNHISAQKLLDTLQSDVFAFHGLTQVFLDGKWVKCTPAFNVELCEKFSVAALEFDGETDSIFQEFDAEGGKFMQYLNDHGTFPDFPRELFIGVLIYHYPHLFNPERIKMLLWNGKGVSA